MLIYISKYKTQRYGKIIKLHKMSKLDQRYGKTRDKTKQDE